jgi:hypothetical protein
MKRLIDLKQPKERFARSVNVERDSGSTAIDGYLPVGRALEAIDRLARALSAESTEVALSVTGPYGSGKSSLALVLDSLFAPAGDPARLSAEALMEAAAPETLRLIHQALESNEAKDRGFVRAVVTAQREPIANTVVRALLHGAERYRASKADAGKLARVTRTLRELDRALRTSSGRLDTRSIRDVVRDLSDVGPILLLIDEFGKNLEAFAESPGDGDLFLLQELAEWTRRGSGARIALVTLQHMAFGDYADGASHVQRREWVKIQGRFEDIPFVDTPGQALALVAAAFEMAHGSLDEPLDRWGRAQSENLRSLGLSELAANPDILSACWPLHPVALAVLPELCQRYGQNERTMFSFLASNEPLSVKSFLAGTPAVVENPPAVHLDRLYDYFLESASNMVSVSADASRWLEVDTRIRDAFGMDEASRRVLKTIGLLNLISAGGSLRASRALITYATNDGGKGTSSSKEIDEVLGRLEHAGLVTFREFADEYRVWQGSDFDLKSAIEVARRRLRDEAPRELLRRVIPLGPIVAARHSHKGGTLRSFEQDWVDATVQTIAPLSSRDRGDGLVLYVVGTEPPKDLVRSTSIDKPIVLVTTGDDSPLLEAARELAAIDEVMATDDEVRSDWVIRRELGERRTAVASSVRSHFERAFGATSESAVWHWVQRKNVGKSGNVWKSPRHQSPSSVLSEVCDSYYDAAPTIRNELINRHELS